MNQDLKQVVIVGGGFAGIRLALDLAKKNLNNTKVTLISNKHHFEYYPRIYRAVVGESPLEVCIRLDDIFKKTKVNVVIDEVVSLSYTTKEVIGKSGSVYNYTDLVITLGSETVYFNIPGLEEKAYGFKSIAEALKLKKHLHEIFDIYLSSKKEDVIAQLHIVVVGGGPSGIELCGELVQYMKKLAKSHSVDNKFVTIDLVESSARLAPMLPADVSEAIYNRLHKLGVNVFLNRTVVKEDVDEIVMKDMSFKANTLVWTAGSRANHLYGSLVGLHTNKAGKVIVGEYLNAEGVEDIYVLGDGAMTQYSGMAQTAIYDGEYMASLLSRKYKGMELPLYKPKKVAYAVPVGKYWAAVSVGPFKIYGFIAWILRQFIDLQFFFSILGFRDSIQIFFSSKHSVETCPTCNEGLELS